MLLDVAILNLNYKITLGGTLSVNNYVAKVVVFLANIFFFKKEKKKIRVH